jgi:hypothetical protein
LPGDVEKKAALTKYVKRGPRSYFAFIPRANRKVRCQRENRRLPSKAAVNVNGRSSKLRVTGSRGTVMNNGSTGARTLVTAAAVGSGFTNADWASGSDGGSTPAGGTLRAGAPSTGIAGPGPPPAPSLGPRGSGARSGALHAPRRRKRTPARGRISPSCGA